MRLFTIMTTLVGIVLGGPQAYAALRSQGVQPNSIIAGSAAIIAVALAIWAGLQLRARNKKIAEQAAEVARTKRENSELLTEIAAGACQQQ